MFYLLNIHTRVVRAFTFLLIGLVSAASSIEAAPDAGTLVFSNFNNPISPAPTPLGRDAANYEADTTGITPDFRGPDPTPVESPASSKLWLNYNSEGTYERLTGIGGDSGPCLQMRVTGGQSHRFSPDYPDGSQHWKTRIELMKIRDTLKNGNFGNESQSERWYYFDVFIPSGPWNKTASQGTRPDPIIAQWHPGPTYNSSGPSIAMQLLSSNQLGIYLPGPNVTIPACYDQWQRFRWHMRWSTQNAGYGLTEVWRALAAPGTHDFGAPPAYTLLASAGGINSVNRYDATNPKAADNDNPNLSWLEYKVGIYFGDAGHQAGWADFPDFINWQFRLAFDNLEERRNPRFEDKAYLIRNRNSNYVLDVNNSTANGTLLTQQMASSSSGQKWGFEYQDADGSWRLKNVLSQKYLAIESDSTLSGKRLLQRDSGSSLLWTTPTATDAGFSRLKNTQSGLYGRVQNSSTTSGGQIVQEALSSSLWSQQWKLEAAP